MRIVVAGNCQITPLTNCLKVITGVGDIESVHIRKLQQRGDASPDLRGDVIFAQPRAAELLGSTKAGANADIITYPSLVYCAYHPDVTVIHSSEGRSIGSSLIYSSYIAVAGFLKGWSVEETLAAFNAENYERLGYFEMRHKADAIFLRHVGHYGFDLKDALKSWHEAGCFMHTVNHPKLKVFSDLAVELAQRAGLEPRSVKAEDFVADRMKESVVMPVYPELAERFGISGSYFFREAVAHGGALIGLREFVERSYAAYRDGSLEGAKTLSGAHHRLEDLQSLANLPLHSPATRAPHRPTAKSASPYAKLNPYQFWRKAVAQARAADVDPVVKAPFKIDKSQGIATAGSCFAQHIAHALKQNGYRYLVAEAPPAGLSGQQEQQRNFGVFSARYGNVYTSRQLLQLFDRAFGLFMPEESAWPGPDGRFVDPFRPQIEPDGFATVEDLLISRDEHFAAVRDMFQKLDVFVFTLGLTEAWQSAGDGAIFPLAPGVAGGEFDAAKHRFVNFSARDVGEDLVTFVDKLKELNENAKVILTVSPVPLIATYEDRSVLTSTTYSKSALRSAAEDVCRSRPDVAYFPSYEVVTGSFNRGAYFEDDLRSVSPEGIAHVMRLFFAHYGKPEPRVQTGDKAPESAFDIVCEEELLDSAL